MSKIVMVFGSGSRECAIAYKISDSIHVKHVYICPGNAYNTDKISSIDIIDNLVNTAIHYKSDLVIIGPEDLLADGIVDQLQLNGVQCFGPNKIASQLESSKIFAKEFFSKYDLPTARYESFNNIESAIKYVQSICFKIVIKASGLCAGKGVFIPNDLEESIINIKQAFVLCNEIIIEEYLEGYELSIMAFCDGNITKCMVPSQDYKRAFNDNKGPNTGGMGSYAPVQISDTLQNSIQTILTKTIQGLISEEITFIGVLFAGFMITKQGPVLLEYNVRMGDPETQSVLALLKTDLYEICNKCINGKLNEIDIQWKDNTYATTVVIAAKGYPYMYKTGIPLDVPLENGVFHGGTKIINDKVVSTKGRILSITQTSHTLSDATKLTYDIVKLITNDNDDIYYRTDITN